MLLLNPDAEWWAGTLADYVEVARAHPASGDRRADDPQPGRDHVSERPAASRASSTPSATRSWARSGPTTVHAAGTTWRAGTGSTEREVDWVSGACMLLPRKAFDEVGMLDEAFLLYGEELDLATRLRDAGRAVLFTPEVEVLHASGISTGRSRRMTVSTPRASTGTTASTERRDGGD